MTFDEMFAAVREKMMKADAAGIPEHLAYQFNITGEAQGTFYLEVRDGGLFVEPYAYHDRDVLITCSADTLFKVAGGKTDPVGAVLLGKMKVEGNIDKAMKLKDLFARR